MKKFFICLLCLVSMTCVAQPHIENLYFFKCGEMTVSSLIYGDCDSIHFSYGLYINNELALPPRYSMAFEPKSNLLVFMSRSSEIFFFDTKYQTLINKVQCDYSEDEPVISFKRRWGKAYIYYHTKHARVLLGKYSPRKLTLKLEPIK